MATVPPIACPLCGDTRRMKKPKEIYGHAVCKKCSNGFANRRQFAWIIDIFAFRIFGITAGVLFAVVAIAAEVSESAFTAMALMLDVVLLPVFLMKDGFGGFSPGKAMLGVRVVDVSSGEPIGLGASFKRNLPTMIPFAVFVLAFQMMKGPRLGDKWAKTRVIWRKYASNPVFQTGISPFEPTSVVDMQAALQPLPVGDTNPFRAPDR